MSGRGFCFVASPDYTSSRRRDSCDSAHTWDIKNLCHAQIRILPLAVLVDRLRARTHRRWSAYLSRCDRSWTPGAPRRMRLCRGPQPCERSRRAPSDKARAPDSRRFCARAQARVPVVRRYTLNPRAIAAASLAPRGTITLTQHVRAVSARSVGGGRGWVARQPPLCDCTHFGQGQARGRGSDCSNRNATACQ